MKCSNCDCENSTEANYCSNCGKRVGKSQESINMFVDNKGFAGTNFIENSPITINNVDNEPRAVIEEIHSKKMRIGNYPIKPWYGVLFGVINLLGSIASLVTGVGEGIFLFLVLGVAGVFSAFLGVRLMEKGFLRMAGFNLRVDKDGDLLATKMEGVCPICSGSLMIVERDTVEGPKYFGVCSRNSDHHWRFDHTIFD